MSNFGIAGSDEEDLPRVTTRAFVGDLESIYVTMWERAQRGEPPRSFAVSRGHIGSPSP